MTQGPQAGKRVRVYTDGSCDTASGEGGWSYLLQYGLPYVAPQHATVQQGTVEKEAAGYEANTTNNRMELTAAVKALEALKEPCRVTLVTDSQYLKKAFTDGWLANWLRNDWKTAGKAPVKNQDLWRRLLALSERHELNWQWTKGHAGQRENERVDRLALKARKERR
ncbi:MAG: ribonuclease HI [Deinococcota bacterium]|nr:ribonuclease HI [Deinococcota bacterium]